MRIVQPGEGFVLAARDRGDQLEDALDRTKRFLQARRIGRLVHRRILRPQPRGELYERDVQKVRKLGGVDPAARSMQFNQRDGNTALGLSRHSNLQLINRKYTINQLINPRLAGPIDGTTPRGTREATAEP